MKKTTKRIMNVTLSILMAIVLAIIGVSHIKKNQKKDTPFKKALETSSDTTFLDEYFKKHNSKLLNEITLLEKYIDLSNQINKNKYDKIYITKEQLNESTLLEPDEIEDLLSRYIGCSKELEEETLFEINLQTKLINQYIIENGYRISSELNLCAIKMKFAESYGFDENLTLDIFNTITIPKQKEFEKHGQDSIKIGTNDIAVNSKMRNMIQGTYDLQHNDNKTDYEYNKERNSMIKDSINEVEKTLPKTYKLKIK